MKRREFLIATASAAALNCTGCRKSTKPINHKKLTFNYAGRDFRLTDVHGNVAKEILA